jgi:ribose transport system ATP-binding protein
LPLPGIEIEGLCKSFGLTQALSGVTLSAKKGAVHALIGENGAGKSTLLQILAGVLAPDGGSMRLGGEPYRPKSPEDARRAGVAMVHQELSLCPHLTVAENVLLGEEPSSFGLLRRREMERRAKAALLPILGADHPLLPDAIVGELSPAAQQLVEIGRALASPRSCALILDEPTSSLGKADVERLFSVLRALRDQGLTILYVSHFLEEVQAIADTFTVLRDGEVVKSGQMAEVSLPEIVESMAGRAIEELFPRSPRTRGAVALTLSELGGAQKPANASLTLHRGEVLGIAGLIGAGRTELCRAIFGLDPVRRGEISVGAYRGPASPAERLEQGVGLLSEDRKGEGLAGALSVTDNLTLSKLSGLGPAGLVLPARQRAAAEQWLDKLTIRCRNPGQSVLDLSGGNQQKVALARLLYHAVDVLLLDEPTRGIDVASKAQIYALIDQQASAGKAVLLVSSYLPELLGICDRIAVMHRGVLGPARPVEELSEHGLLLSATGG